MTRIGTRNIKILTMQNFFIVQNSTLPSLVMELIEDGRHDFGKFAECVQGADITFTMTNVDTSVVKISKAGAYIKLRDGDSCGENYVICYDWKARDTKEAGTYKGVFELTFPSDIKSDEYEYPSGVLGMPIRNELIITILPR